MAFGLKYQGTFFSKIENFEYQVSIYQDGFVGSSTDLTFGNVTINRGESDMLQPIKGSESTIEVLNTTDFEFEGEFGSANYGDYYVTIEKDASIIWQGYNIPNTYSEPYQQTPYLTELKFNCGLGHLKYKYFEDAGTLYSGQKSILEVLRLCLNKLPNAANISQSIRESINTYENRLYSGTPTAADSMINSIFVDSGLYKSEVKSGVGSELQGWTCYQVIEEILKVFNARVYSWNNLWFIDQLREQKTSPINYRDFLPRVGSESTVTVDGSGTYGQRQTVNRTTLNPTNQGEITILPALEKISYKYTTQNVDYFGNDLINNGNFGSITTFDPTTYPNSSGYPFNWSYTGFDPSSYSAIFSNGQNSNWFSFDPSSVETNEAFNTGVYIQQTKTGVGLASTDSLRISFRTYIAVEWTTGTLSQYNIAAFYSFIQNAPVTFKLQIKIGTYYLSGTQNSVSWTTTPSYVTITRKLTTAPQGQLPTVYNSSGTMWSDFGITLNTPLIPFSDVVDLDFKIFEPYHEYNNFTDVGGYSVFFDTALFTGIAAVYVPAAAPPEEIVILEHEIDEEAEELSIEVVHGDGASTVSQGSFRLSSGLITQNWNRFGVSETKGIAEIWIEDISELRSAYTRQLSWTLYGYLEQFNVIAHTVDAVTTYYLINGFDFNLVESSFDLTLIKLQSSSRSSFTTKTSNTLTELPVLSLPNEAPTILTLNNPTQRTSFSETTSVEAVEIPNYLNYKKTGYVGYYTFNENTPLVLRDYSQNGQDGTGAAITISNTTRDYGKDAVFNGSTSTCQFPNSSAFDSISQFGLRIAVNLTSNTGTDTIFNIPGVFKINFDGTNLTAILSTTAGDYTLTNNISGLTGTWFDCFIQWSANNIVFYVTDGNVIFEIQSSATSGTTDTVGSIAYYLGYNGSSNHAAFKCNELQIATTTLSTKNLTAYEEQQNGVLITTDSTAYNLGDIIATDWDGENNTGIITYLGTNEIKILPVDGQIYGNTYPIERVGHIWDTGRQWMFVINNDPSICFYNGINLTTLIAAESTKLYCLGLDGIIENSVTKTANYTLTNNDNFIEVDTSGGAFTLALPPTEDATPSGKIFKIIDTGGSCGSNNLTVDGGDYNINGSATGTLTADYESWTLRFNGTEYNLI
jgi:hypothetical protein